MIFKMYNCDFGIKYNDVNYDFDHVDSFTIEDPQMTRLIRGSNAKNKEGLIYTEGVKEPKKVTVVLVGISTAMYSLLKGIFDDKERCECYCVDRVSGSSKIFKDAIISQTPQQLTIDDTAESMNISLILETFNIEEVHKE